MGMPIPFDPRRADFSRGLDEIFVIEEKQPNIESLVKDALYSLPERPRVVGKVDETGTKLVPGYGALDADAILPLLRRRLAGTLGDRLVPRPAGGSGSLSTARRAAHTVLLLGLSPQPLHRGRPTARWSAPASAVTRWPCFMDPERVGEHRWPDRMGNEGTQWIGMAPFVERAHFIQNLGDGTYFHSGQLAVRAAIAARVEHHLQAAVQRHGRHDRRPGPRGPAQRRLGGHRAR